MKKTKATRGFWDWLSAVAGAAPAGRLRLPVLNSD